MTEASKRCSGPSRAVQSSSWTSTKLVARREFGSAYEDIQQNLDPDPSDVQRDLESVRGALDDLCSQLSLSDALSNDWAGGSVRYAPGLTPRVARL
jgi:hypothetical protein